MALTGKVVQLLDSKVQVMILPMSAMFMLSTNPSGGVRTPTHATSVPILFRKGTICVPFVTVLSRLGLNASPENRVKMLGWPAKRGLSR